MELRDVPAPDAAGRRPVDQHTTVAANRRWWDAEAADYYAEHGAFLGDATLVWGPEGVTEADLGLLGDLTGRHVLEFGCGAAQGARFVAGRRARVVACDLSGGMLRQAVRIDAGPSPAVASSSPADEPIASIQCDATRLPFADASFDVVFSAYGAVPFVADSAALMRELARVLRPGGRLAFSVTHPFRWSLPDAPGPEGLTVTSSYFDRTPYVESARGQVVYAEHHRTLGDRIRELRAAGLVPDDVVEPEWPAANESVWGGWSPLRGRLIPGTAIFVAHRP